VSINVRNQLPEATSVHWHGIELENYYYGVAGFGTDGRRVSPMIEPGQAFEALFTPPRAGTSIYHTHMNDLQQVLAGLSGPLIVLNPDETFDPASFFFNPVRAELAKPVLRFCHRETRWGRGGYELICVHRV
jgi:FtsP/CotA-like multicopper oxidase with cupredoxin domain